MIYRIPNSGKFSQPNKGDIFGNIKGTLNADFRTNPGKFKLSPRMTVITKDNDNGLSGFGLPVGFATISAGGTEVVVTITGAGNTGATGSGRVFKNSAVGFGAFTEVSSSPTTVHHEYSDIVSTSLKDSNSIKRLYISLTGALGAQDVAQYDGSSWDNTWFSSTRSGTGLITDSPTHLCPGFNGLLYIGNEFSIRYAPITGNIVGPSSTSDPNTTSGTIHTLGKYIITWIRSSSNRLWVGLIEGSQAAGSSHLGGYVAEWDGGGTAFNKIYKIGAPMAMSCVIKNDIPYIVDAYGVLQKFNGTGFSEVARLPVANTNYEMPGIYSAYSNSRWIHPRGMDLVNGKINILLNNYVSSGVYVDEMPSGVWEYDEEIGLYHKNSPCADSNDYGQQYVEGVGAIFGMKKTAGSFLAGVSYYTDSGSTNRKAIFYDDISTGTDKRGLLLTPFLPAEQITDEWQKSFYRFNYLPSGDKIISKTRIRKSSTLPFIANVTWTSTTTFTSTDADFANAAVGDEVEVVQGKRASTTAHISAISYSNPTYTITLEDTIGSASGSAVVRVDNFRKQGVIDAQNVSEGEIGIGEKSTKVQVKTEFRASATFELDDLTVVNQSDKKI